MAQGVPAVGRAVDAVGRVAVEPAVLPDLAPGVGVLGLGAAGVVCGGRVTGRVCGVRGVALAQQRVDQRPVPRVVQHYREARQVRDSSGEVDTERQRTAVTSYRSLIDALLGDSDTADTAGDATSAHDTRRTAEHAAARRDNQLDGDATDRVDGTSAGRHALRHDESGAAGPDDTRGARRPRTEEEHTR